MLTINVLIQARIILQYVFMEKYKITCNSTSEKLTSHMQNGQQYNIIRVYVPLLHIFI